MSVLKNKTRHPQVFNLDAPFFVGNRNETAAGKPCSISFLALEKKEVDDAVVSCDSVKTALSKGILRDLTPKKKAAAAVVGKKKSASSRSSKKS